MRHICLFAFVVLTGCASLPAGVQMTREEITACAAEGCSVWTLDELKRLVRKAMQQGYASGRKSL